MSTIDFVVLIGTIVSIAAYGVWRTRRMADLNHYLKGDKNTGWGTIGLSVMATQASAITFLSMPGQAYENGIAFIQNYFGLPLALIIIAAVFVPLYRRLKVYTAYEFLGIRFDNKTRLLGAGLFLLQRGLAAGITIYAPSIIVSTVLGWPLDITIILTGITVIIYTVSGGTRAVSITQKWQMGVIMTGMFVAFIILLIKMPAPLGFSDMLHVAGEFGKLEAVDLSLDFDKRYTVWSGIFGGLFLSLSYFGTDQSQVQRYLSGTSIRESRLGLMFNAVLKIPMQFFILLLGALVFVFYQFEQPPLYFNQTAMQAQTEGVHGDALRTLQERHSELHDEKAAAIMAWTDARRNGDSQLEASTRADMLAAHDRNERLRDETREVLISADPSISPVDSDYVFITFVLNYLPQGFIGLLLAVIFAAALSSTAAELNALGSTTFVDIYHNLRKKKTSDKHRVMASRLFTLMWGLIAISFALFANLVENLIEAINILGSVFYGVVLGLFLVAFFLKRVGGTAVFTGAVIAQAIVIGFYLTADIGYLWFNLIGCASTVLLSLAIQSVLNVRRGVLRI
jgi:solute:Na+ symporter, SSS family